MDDTYKFQRLGPAILFSPCSISSDQNVYKDYTPIITEAILVKRIARSKSCLIRVEFHAWFQSYFPVVILS